MDTAGWVACADAADLKHVKSMEARDRWLSAGGGLVTTDYVVDETLTVIRRRLGLAAAEAWFRQVDASRRLRWELVDPSRAEKARRWFFEYRDKEFSFTDCTSFVVMKDLKIRDVLTTDRHFAQAGFVPLP